MNFTVSNNNKAKLLMVLSALAFSIMAAEVKATAHTVAIKAFARQIFSCLIVLIIIIIKNQRIIPLKQNRIKLFLRCLFGTLGMYLYFYSIDNLSLVNASMLTRITPFFVTVLAVIILKETVDNLNWIIFLPMIFGCVLIIKPNSELFNPAAIIAVLSACSGAMAYIMIKAIGKEESAYTIIFWFTLVSSGIYFIIAKDEFSSIDKLQYLNLVIIGLFGVLGQIGLTLSYQLSKASYVAPYSYFYIIFSGIIGVYIWQEIPDIFSIIGFICIFLSYFYLIRFQSKTQRN